MNRYEINLEGFLTTQGYIPDQNTAIHLRQIGFGSVLLVVPTGTIPLDGHFRNAKITMQIEVDPDSKFVPEQKGQS